MAAGVRRSTLPLAAALLGALLAGLSMTVSAGQRADALTNCSVTHDALDSEEQAFLALINQYRAQNGLGPLTISTNLNRAAAWMVEDMATKGYFSHTDSLGRSPYQRAIDCGYPSGAGENLAAGSSWSTAQAAFEAWRNSPGHNQNMLTSFYQQIGIARYYRAGSPYGWYWATNFGATNDGTGGGGAGQPTATPTNTPTATPTSTSTPTPTNTPATPSPSPSPTSTPTPLPPTATPTPPGGTGGGGQWQPTATPTMPPLPPTATPTPRQASPTPTVTPTREATATPTPTPRQGNGGAPSLPLSPGANLIAWPGSPVSPAEVFGSNSQVAVVYEWDPATGTWKRYLPGMPAYLNTLGQLRPGAAYWVIAKGQAQVAVR
ncbi:CAP domain-containing protein [Tepidiforma thermophila]|uniref:Uncharacterized protein YkwD n=1 Tax=Tepidiforma thermophila (strain KCTC 52669 / CGMCC 1.13589 / G233) TaxID=2761530 RepID=A0A2A9HGM7_TEPT2|nr:CAP domain-containing protein [Tepidiforma thermophila]PFG75174.1 uncharacterized protein YkwD [Tepidiforma thermophila]